MLNLNDTAKCQAPYNYIMRPSSDANVRGEEYKRHKYDEKGIINLQLHRGCVHYHRCCAEERGEEVLLGGEMDVGVEVVGVCDVNGAW